MADQYIALFYHIGIRDSFSMKNNILIYNDTSAKGTREIRESCAKIQCHSLVTYQVIDKQCIVTEPSGSGLVDSNNCVTLSSKLKQLLQKVDVQTK